MCTNCSTRSVPSRRGFMLGGAALATAGMAGLRPADAFAQDALTVPQNAITGDAALKRIMDGNARYVASTPTHRDNWASRAARTLGQHPVAAIVSCADSRVAPELCFDQGPGDLFVVRVAGNFVNNDGLASLEFGTMVLGSPLILVLGHTSCGAIVSTIKVMNEGLQLPGHLPELVASLKPGVAAAQKENPTDLVAAATIANVKVNMERLKKDSPVLTERMAQGKLAIAGGVYDLATGKVSLV